MTLPEDMRLWVGKDHLAWFLTDVIDDLDATALAALAGRRWRPLRRPLAGEMAWGYAIPPTLRAGIAYTADPASPRRRALGLPGTCTATMRPVVKEDP